MTAPLPAPPPAIVGPADISLRADRLELDEAIGVLTATGHVVLERAGVRLTAEALRYSRRSGQGEIRGPIRVQAAGFEVDAERATFDLTARVADLHAFRGRWGRRAQFAGERMRLADDVIELVGAAGSPCQHADPDLQVAARAFRYYPKATRLNLTANGVALRVAGRDLVALPEIHTWVDDVHRPGFETWIFPSLGFDAYHGLISGTSFDFTLGQGSRGAIPIIFSSGRGISAGIEHALGVGPGEVLNGAKYETPWATGQGGFRASNGYAWRGRDGSRYELMADYRANMNEQAVHRLPEAVWALPYHRLGGVISYQSELRAGYLWEESSNVQATRFRWVMPFSTPIWRPIPAWQTWVDGSPWANHYGFGHFVGGSVAWHHRVGLMPDLAVTQAVETVRTEGQTPYVFERLIGADRVRLGLEKSWGPRVSTYVNTSWSRMNHQGPLVVEDVGVTGIYRWNCFSLQLTVRPLVWGVDTKFNLVDM